MSDENLGENKFVYLFVGWFFLRAFKSSRKAMFLIEKCSVLISESSLKCCDLIQLSIAVKDIINLILKWCFQANMVMYH